MEVATTTTAFFTQRAFEDYELVQQAVQGSQQAYAVLMQRYEPSVYRTMFRMVRNPEDATDLTIEAFGKAFCNLIHYVPRHAFSTWLFRIAINNCIDHIRRKRMVLLSLDELAEGAFSSELSHTEYLRDRARDPEEQTIRQQKLELMRRVMLELPLRYRTIIQLRYFDELSYHEIAAALDVPLGTVKAKLYRAKELLYELLQKPGNSNYLDSVQRRKRKQKSLA
ncbi:MAG TPA: sigma-70 family RNA polymerase sigma factor [Saprospiraceae bacterium]|nr:sigma-70 family RNA polymerase sigma factor [Saprospiraceae bacterium]HMP23570.1 sigma-70 family RNA polymerase sigma factor [Saprospiraceae bacterium]